MINIKHAMISLIFSLLLTSGSVLVVLLLIKNVGSIIQIFSDNELLIKILTEQSKKKISLPFPIIFSIFLVFFPLIYYFFKK